MTEAKHSPLPADDLKERLRALACFRKTPAEALDRIASLEAQIAEQPEAIRFWHDRARAVEAQLAEARKALETFTAHYSPWMDTYADDIECTVHSRHTFGQLKGARFLLHPKPTGDQS